MMLLIIAQHFIQLVTIKGSNKRIEISFRSHKSRYFDIFNSELRASVFDFNDHINVCNDTGSFCNALN